MNIFLNLCTSEINFFSRNFQETSEIYACSSEVYHLSDDIKTRSMYKYQILDNTKILLEDLICNKNIFLLYEKFENILKYKNSFKKCNINIMRPILNEVEKNHLEKVFSQNNVQFVFDRQGCVNASDYFRMGSITNKYKTSSIQEVWIVDSETLQVFSEDYVKELIKEKVCNFSVEMKVIETGRSRVKKGPSFFLKRRTYDTGLLDKNVQLISNMKCYLSHRVDTIESVFAQNNSSFVEV